MSRRKCPAIWAMSSHPEWSRTGAGEGTVLKKIGDWVSDDTTVSQVKPGTSTSRPIVMQDNEQQLFKSLGNEWFYFLQPEASHLIQINCRWNGMETREFTKQNPNVELLRIQNKNDISESRAESSYASVRILRDFQRWWKECGWRSEMMEGRFHNSEKAKQWRYHTTTLKRKWTGEETD